MKATNSQHARFVEIFSCFFANDVGGLLVAAEPEESGMPHLGHLSTQRILPHRTFRDSALCSAGVPRVQGR